MVKHIQSSRSKQFSSWYFSSSSCDTFELHAIFDSLFDYTIKMWCIFKQLSSSSGCCPFTFLTPLPNDIEKNTPTFINTSPNPLICSKIPAPCLRSLPYNSVRESSLIRSGGLKNLQRIYFYFYQCKIGNLY